MTSSYTGVGSEPVSVGRVLTKGELFVDSSQAPPIQNKTDAGRNTNSKYTKKQRTKDKNDHPPSRPTDRRDTQETKNESSPENDRKA